MSTINVTSNADNSAGSLREAIAQAKSDDTIQFGSNLANQTINLTSGELTVDKNLTVDSAGTSGLTISGNNASRIFDVIYTDGANASGANFDHGSVGGTITIRNSKYEA